MPANWGSLKIINRIASKLAWWKQGRVPILAGFGEALLNRPFSKRTSCRVLLAYQNDMLAYPQFASFLNATERFVDCRIEFRATPYKKLAADRLPDDLDAIFIQSSYEPAVGELENLMNALKLRLPDLEIAYFDWFAPADIRFAARVDPWVSHYVKKSLLRDRSAYLRTGLGHSNLSDFFSARFGTENPPGEWKIPASILPKLSVGPSFSTSPDLVHYFQQTRPPAARSRSIDIHARLATSGTPWYSAMRGEAAAVVARDFQDLNVASEGFVPKSKYMRELRRSKLCFSPFGYGEVCWRDFEAVAVGTVLVKPDMSHLETEPDIYRPFETYVPVRWDLSDLNERVRRALADPEGTRRMALRAFDVVRDHLRGPAMVDLAMRCAGRDH